MATYFAESIGQQQLNRKNKNKNGLSVNPFVFERGLDFM
jgi:hypothetical protein